mgnify:CR=1 FL=1
MKNSFDDLPNAVSQLAEKLNQIEELIRSQKNQPQVEEDKLLTIKEASRLLSLTVPTVYGLVQRREIPVCKKGKRLYFSKSEVIEWIKTGRKKTNEQVDQATERYLLKRKRSIL